MDKERNADTLADLLKEYRDQAQSSEEETDIE